MALYFLDSSALVKRYISETGSTWVLGLFAPALKNEIFIAAIAIVFREGLWRGMLDLLLNYWELMKS